MRVDSDYLEKLSDCKEYLWRQRFVNPNLQTLSKKDETKSVEGEEENPSATLVNDRQKTRGGGGAH